MNHKPATALPWKSIPYRYVLNSATRARIHAENNDPVVDDANPSFDDAAYIAHACNAYPELVEALKWMREEYARLPHSLGYTFTHLPKVDALLAKLGEAA